MDEFLRLSEACSNWTLIDRAHGIQAAVDDESYLQRWVWPGISWPQSMHVLLALLCGLAMQWMHH